MKRDNPGPLVSVIMPTYNQAQFINQSINSVLNQTYKNLELIIIDNYSADDTEKMVSSCKTNDSRVKYTKFSNNGVIAASRNLGIKMARGEFIAFIDSDDLWLPEKLEIQIERFKKDSQIDLLYCRNIWVLADGRKRLKRLKDVRTFNSLIFSNSITCSSVVAKKEVLTEAALFDEDPYLVTMDDTELWLRLLYKGAKIRSLSQPLVIYRVHGGSNLRAGHYKVGTKNFYMCSRLFLKLDIAGYSQLKIWSVLFIKAVKNSIIGLFTLRSGG